MAKKDSFYFNNFVESAQVSCEAACTLKAILSDFSADTLEKNRVLLHEIEHKGDDKRHEMTNVLVRAFITPIEREDMLKLSQYIDDVTDSIEDILIRIYINNVTSIRPDSLEFIDIVIDCCNAMKQMLEEFHNFKRPRKLNEFIIEINRLEELGDDLYVRCMRNLHTTAKDPLEIIAWREIYDFFEKCCDTCVNVADIIESIVIGNT
jgi:predicted phosphate transport protein (TIGR00153 family)